jgi:hypothetical protein
MCLFVEKKEIKRADKKLFGKKRVSLLLLSLLLGLVKVGSFKFFYKSALIVDKCVFVRVLARSYCF